jgi:NAD(P)-dependent dehydrogenase (short-subunit alcohol dehydrogenase family)
MSLNGKVVLVTGGAGALGFACVQRCLDRGAKVAFCDRSVELTGKAVSDLSRDYADTEYMGSTVDVANSSEGEPAQRAKSAPLLCK